MNIKTSRTLPPSCMYCLGELSRMVGTPANMLFPSERDSARSSNKPPPRARFLRMETPGSSPELSRLSSATRPHPGEDQATMGRPFRPFLHTKQDQEGTSPWDHLQEAFCRWGHGCVCTTNSDGQPGHTGPRPHLSLSADRLGPCKQVPFHSDPHAPHRETRGRNR